MEGKYFSKEEFQTILTFLANESFLVKIRVLAICSLALEKTPQFTQETLRAIPVLFEELNCELVEYALHVYKTGLEKSRGPIDWEVVRRIMKFIEPNFIEEIRGIAIGICKSVARREPRFHLELLTFSFQLGIFSLSSDVIGTILRETPDLITQAIHFLNERISHE